MFRRERDFVVVVIMVVVVVVVPRLRGFMLFFVSKNFVVVDVDDVRGLGA